MEAEVKGLTAREMSVLKDYMDSEKDNKIEIAEMEQAFLRCNPSPEAWP